MSANPSPKVSFKKAGRDSSPGRHLDCRRMLVGPWCNQPEEYPGYNGLVGWAGAACSRSGRLMVSFTSGYWHGSLPCTDEMLEDPYFKELFTTRRARFGGLVDLRAPRGGRAHLMVSDDQGKTWSGPETLVDTECDDRHPCLLELDDGTLLCTLFTARMRHPSERSACQGSPRKNSMYVLYAKYMLSSDGGKSWTEPMVADDVDDPVQGCTSPAIQLSDGSVLWLIPGRHDPAAPDRPGTGVYRSSDRGKTFERISFISTDHDLHEPTVAELPDGRLVTLARRQGDICFSDDGGRTWSEPVTFGTEMFDPKLLMLPNDVLACFHGSYQALGLRVILSKDGGMTWHGPDDCYGYAVDPKVYGYSGATLLPDGTVYVVYNHTGGHYAADARTAALWGLRVRVNDTADGIEVLPAPGSPAAEGRSTTGLAYIDNRSEDPELGEQE